MRIAVDGVIARGSMFKVKDFSATPRQEITETPYCGEDEDDLDFQHHGFDLSWSVDLLDATTINLLSTIVDRERNHERHPEITVTVIYAFREGAAAGSGKVIVYHDNLVLKQGDEGFSGRKEFVSVKYEAKCKKRHALDAA